MGDESRVWGKITPEADKRIRLLSIDRTGRGTVGRVVGQAIREYLRDHVAAHQLVIDRYIQSGQKSAWPSISGKGVHGCNRIWGIVSIEEFRRLKWLVQVYGLSDTNQLIAVAVDNFLKEHQHEHDRIIEALYAEQKAWSAAAVAAAE